MVAGGHPRGAVQVEADAVDLAPTYRRLGELYEARGDRTNAMVYYNKFVDLWKNADPNLTLLKKAHALRDELVVVPKN